MVSRQRRARKRAAEALRRCCYGLCWLLILLPCGVLFLPPAEAAKAPLHISALHMSGEGEEERMVLSGDVTISDDDFSVHGDELHLNLKDNSAQFVGEVTLALRDQSLQGRDLWLNLDTREWTFSDARIELQPGFLGKGAKGPVYLFGKQLSGSPREIHLVQGGFTTCDLPHPHYSLTAGEVLIVVGDRLTARQNSLWVGGRRVATFPSFSLPLKPIRRPPYLPEMGRNRLEGFFANTSYDYLATAKATGTLLLSTSERQGTSTALNHSYSSSQGSGEIYLYRQWEKDALNARLHHRQTIGRDIKLDSSGSYVRNTYYSTAAYTTTNTNSTVSHQGPSSATSLSLGTSRTLGNFSRSTLSASLRHSQQIEQRLSATISANMQNNSALGGFWDKELQSAVELSGQAPNFNWRLTQDKRDDLDGDSYSGDANYSFIERLPELVLQTSTDRLHWNALGPLQGDLQMLLSRTTERRSGRELSKGSLDVRPSGRQIVLSPSSTLDLATGFRQSFYEGGAAQYVLNTNANWRNRLGGDWDAGVRYNYREAAGFSPFDVDQVPSQSSLDLNVALDRPSARVTLSSGYDLRRAVYRDALLRASFGSSNAMLSLSTAYGIENSRFRPLLVRYSRQSKGDGLSLDTSLRYDLEAGKPNALLARVEWPVSKQWRFEAVSRYNGLREKFDYNDLRITKDLHCFLATASYSQQRKELRFNLMIKAFPIADRNFGVSTYGQQLGTGVGEAY